MSKQKAEIVGYAIHKISHSLYCWWSDGKVTRLQQEITDEGAVPFGDHKNVPLVFWNPLEFFVYKENTSNNDDM